MEPELTVLDSLRKAVEAMPDDVPLRLHLATMLLQAGQRDEAVRQIGAVLQRDPGNAKALGMLRGSGPEPTAAAGQPPLGDPHQLVPQFAWSRVPAHDRLARWADGLVIE